ncbi:MAG: 1-acyl-sn-glycerol-3-phosphate acyltransferase [Proteobacteria bacterium]|nr:1-acyl-sn-glycerol-3-phosphate acyltransferase [Pseudomonadota bacterium]
MRRRFYGLWCIGWLTPTAVCVLLLNLFVPRLRSRRAVARAASRCFLRIAGIPFRVEGLEQLPAAPCVVVANHASYLDGLVVLAALPPDFAFVIKKEMVRVPVAGVLLRRLGSEFVERFDRHRGAVDARRVLKRAATGESLVFFPEGTFTERRAVGKFHGGAFATAARNRMPVVALAVHGTREALPSGTLLMRRVPIRVQVLATFHAAAPQVDAGDIRQQARALIASAVGEPLAP